MGIIVLPFLVVLLVIWVASLLKIIDLIYFKEFSWNMLWLGLGLNFLIYLAIILSFIFEKRVYSFTPIFRFGLYWYIIPFFASKFVYSLSEKYAKLLTNAILIQVLLAGIITMVLNDFVFGILEKINVESYY